MPAEAPAEISGKPPTDVLLNLAEGCMPWSVPHLLGVHATRAGRQEERTRKTKTERKAPPPPPAAFLQCPSSTLLTKLNVEPIGRGGFIGSSSAITEKGREGWI